MFLKKFFTLSILSTLLFSNINAAVVLTNHKFLDGTECKISASGSFDIGAIYINSKTPNKNPITNRSESELTGFSIADIGITAEFDNGLMQYGVTLGITPSANNSRGVNSNLYVKNSNFEVSLGHGHAAATKLTIAGFSAPIGSPCMGLFYPSDSKTAYVLRDGLSFLSLRNPPGHDRARNITFLYSGDISANSSLKVGFSYIPTDASVGSLSHNSLEFRDHPYIKNLFIESKHAISAGLRINYTLDIATLGFSLAYEKAIETLIYRKIKDETIAPTDTNKDLEIKPYQAFATGLSIKFDHGEIIGGATYLGESFKCKALTDKNFTGDKKEQNKTSENNNTNSNEKKDSSTTSNSDKSQISEFTTFNDNAYYVFVGGSLNYNDFSIGAKYGFSSNLYRNDFDCFSISAQYKVTGIAFYASLDYYRYNRRCYASLTDISDKKISDLATDLNVKDKSDEETKKSVTTSLFNFKKYELVKTDKSTDEKPEYKPQAHDEIKYNIQESNDKLAGFQNSSTIIAVGIKISF